MLFLNKYYKKKKKFLINFYFKYNKINFIKKINKLLTKKNSFLRFRSHFLNKLRVKHLIRFKFIESPNKEI